MTYDGDRRRLPVYEDTPEYRRRFVVGERRQVRVTVGWWALRDFYDAIRARLGGKIAT